MEADSMLLFLICEMFLAQGKDDGGKVGEPAGRKVPFRPPVPDADSKRFLDILEKAMAEHKEPPARPAEPDWEAVAARVKEVPYKFERGQVVRDKPGRGNSTGVFVRYLTDAEREKAGWPYSALCPADCVCCTGIGPGGRLLLCLANSVDIEPLSR